MKRSLFKMCDNNHTIKIRIDIRNHCEKRPIFSPLCIRIIFPKLCTQKKKRAALGRVARCVAPALVVQFVRCQRPGFTVNGTGSLGSVIVSSPVPASMSMVTVLGFNPKRFSALNAGSQSGTPSEVLPAKTLT